MVYFRQGLCALPDDERGDGVADAVADLEHILQEALREKFRNGTPIIACKGSL